MNIQKELCVWFKENHRELIFRKDKNPYSIWVSEIMAQQTRIDSMLPYYEKWMQDYPTIEALASAPIEKILKSWEGLGYYNRARKLYEGAKQVMCEYNGILPDDYDELLKISGIGPYTAGAIASIAYNKEIPAVDGNVLRILTRVAEDDTDIMKASFRKQVELQLMEYMQSEAFVGKSPADYNQALMELGATVCLPNGAPNCQECPWRELCQARKNNSISELPVKAKAKQRRIEKRTVFVIRDGERVAIRKRPKKGLLAGLYELPNVEGHLSQEEALLYVKEQSLSPIRIQKLPEAKHIFSHVEWQMQGYAVLIEEPEQIQSFLYVEAVTSEQQYAIPAAFAAYAKFMGIKIGQERFLEVDTSEILLR